MTWELTEQDPSRVADRYVVERVLGRGGMGSVYRIRDSATGQELALKRLQGKGGTVPSPTAVELFEREFNTLNQLVHPRVVRAFDYGIDDERPFYTLELLDGGDLREHAPMPWERVCSVAYELCSVLALLHSRKLVHRDLTPRNVRLTGDGMAKLIDFGLLSPIGPVEHLAGTPPYMAPEVVNSMTLDGRADLFALGATLYFALTGTVAFPARNLTELRDAWRGVPRRICELNPGVPAPLERLVSSLLRLDVDSRPRSAAEVMELLRPLLPHPPSEELVLAQAHLGAPSLVARTTEQTRMRRQLMRTVRRRGGGFLITGAPGTGRSRMLDLFVLEAKLLGLVAARASGSDGASGPFGVARTLVAQLHESAPQESLAVARQDPVALRLLFGLDAEALARSERGDQAPFRALRDFASAQHDGGHDRDREAGQVQAALRTWILGLSERRPVAIAVDDLESVDGPSAALLAGLAVEAGRRRLTYAVTTEADDESESPSSVPRALVERARRMALSPLEADQTTLLLRSVFGDVPNLQSTALHLHRVARGCPRECMALAQHLVDRRMVRHENGAWVLPPQIQADALPVSMESELTEKIGKLSAVATRAARLLALSVVGRLSWNELRELVGDSPAALQDALEELRQAGVLAGNPEGYVSHAAASAIVREGCPPKDRVRLHAALAESSARRHAVAMVVTHHLLQGDQPDRGVQLLLSHMVTDEQGRRCMAAGVATVGLSACATTIQRAYAWARKHDYPPGDQLTLALLQEVSATHGADPKYFYEAEPTVTAMLKRASGYDDWVSLCQVSDSLNRAQQALASVGKRHEEAAPSDRVKSPAEAISWMVKHALQAMVIGARANDLELQASVPGLLEPFTLLSPAVDAMRRNIVANHLLALGATETARDIWLKLEEDLADFDVSELPEIDYVRPSVRLKATLIEVAAGFGTAPSFDTEDTDVASLRANIEGVRRLAALQLGDWEAAETHRRNTELVVLASGDSGMFNWIEMEWPVHALLRDLTGMRAIRERLAPLAQRHPGWVPAQLAVEASYHRLREQPEAALAAVHTLRKLVQNVAIVPQAFYRAVEVEVAVLVETGRAEDGLDRGLAALAAGRADGRRALAHGIALEVALAEATLGMYEDARARIVAEISWQTERGVHGLLMGRSYEYLARVALACRDRGAFDKAARRAAQEYRVDAGSMLAVRYRTLLDDAQRVNMNTGAPVPSTGQAHEPDQGPASSLLSELSARGDTDTVTREGLRLLCDAYRAGGGCLYLLCDEGLTMAASQGEPDDRESIANYAQAQLDLEVDDGAFTVTAGSFTATAANDTMLTEATLGPQGSRLQAVPLRTPVDGVDHLIGIAVVVIGRDDVLPSGQLAELVSGLARCLHESGRYQAIRAA
ncbi:MAG: serine/threonine-protein kinase [Myxococcales bacterium]|nr:serine/threonine-protein kinase [Myxococcales bacterium]MDD9967507.1 serine/threonine-protein kinase [Myxococcales bacterium]